MAAREAWRSENMQINLSDWKSVRRVRNKSGADIGKAPRRGENPRTAFAEENRALIAGK